MKLITSFTAIIAAASAGHIFSQPQAEHYAQTADAYQSAVEYQQPSYASQSGGEYQQPSYASQSGGEYQQPSYASQSGGEYHQQNHAGQSQVFSDHTDVAAGDLGGHEIAYQERPSKDAYARILAYHSDTDGHNYQYAYETENGIKAQEVGAVHKGTRAEGAYSYKGDDGHIYTVNYIADEHGFRASGAHLPTPPPIPEAILKSLEQNAKDEAAGIIDDGSYQHQQHQGQNYQYEDYQQEVYHGAPAQAISGADIGYHH